MKQLSAGILIHDSNNNLLLGHSTGNSHWDIPKGLVDENETVKETALRECLEEFNIDLSNKEIIEVGKFKLNKKKNIFLFTICVDSLEALLPLCKCNSFFENHKNITLPEIDDYIIISFSDKEQYLSKGLFKIINSLSL